MGGMILLGDHIYMGHGHNNGFPTCVEFLTGKVVWGKERGPGSGSAAIVYADGHLYFRYQDATMALIEATTKGYNLKGSFRLASNSLKAGHTRLSSTASFMSATRMCCFATTCGRSNNHPGADKTRGRSRPRPIERALPNVQGASDTTTNPAADSLSPRRRSGERGFQQSATIRWNEPLSPLVPRSERDLREPKPCFENVWQLKRKSSTPPSATKCSARSKNSERCMSTRGRWPRQSFC